MYTFIQPYTSTSFNKIYYAKMEFLHLREYTYPTSTYIQATEVATVILKRGKWVETPSGGRSSFPVSECYPTFEEAYIAKLRALQRLSLKYDAQIAKLEAKRLKAFGPVFDELAKAQEEHPEYFL